MPRIYLDHAATTPLDARVFDAMVPYLKEHFGNASSVHALGRKARVAVEASRERIAAHLGAEPAEIVFTSGGTEADNAALRGLRPAARPGLLISAAEHEAILKPAARLAAAGEFVTVLQPDAHGAVTPAAVAAALENSLTDAQADAVGLVSLMHANNEVGTLTDLPGVAAVCQAQGVRVHTDAVQTAGLYPLDVDALGVDALSASAHKFYGPKGIGFLYVRGGTDFRPLVEGGSQERSRRAGTENVASLVGMAAALDLAVAASEARRAHLLALRTRLHDGLRAVLGEGFVCQTPLEPGAAAPHVLNIAFPPEDGRPLDGEMLLLNLDMEGIYVSSGSACTSGAIEPSHVLLAMGRPRETAAAALRFSLGKDNTPGEIDFVIDRLAAILARMRR